jgi:hypothetical protein
MPRYFTRPKSLWVADETYDEPMCLGTPEVPDHVATDTGLLDQNGDAIMRAPNPIGFVWNFDQ